MYLVYVWSVGNNTDLTACGFSCHSKSRAKVFLPIKWAVESLPPWLSPALKVFPCTKKLKEAKARWAILLLNSSFLQDEWTLAHTGSCPWGDSAALPCDFSIKQELVHASHLPQPQWPWPFALPLVTGLFHAVPPARNTPPSCSGLANAHRPSGLSSPL